MTDPKKFVAGLSIPIVKADEGFSAAIQVAGLESAEDDKQEAYVNNKSLVSFVADIPGQLRKDVLNSTLLAQRVADHYFPKPEDILQWYDKYIEVMTGVGWTFEQKEFSNYDSSSNLFEMESAIVGILTALAGQNYAAVIQGTLEALKGLADDNDIIKVFEKNTHGLQKGNFQIGLTTAKDGVVSMQIGAFMLNSRDNIHNILFFKSGKDKIQLNFYTIKCTLNEDNYALVRNDILAKLGQSTKTFIAKLPDFS